MARWTASAKWAAGPALDGRRDMPLALRLSEGLGHAAQVGMNLRKFVVAERYPFGPPGALPDWEHAKCDGGLHVGVKVVAD